MDNWYFQHDGEQFGPVAFAVLCKFAVKGVVVPSTLVREGNTGSWVEARTIDGLVCSPCHDQPGPASSDHPTADSGESAETEREDVYRLMLPQSSEINGGNQEVYIFQDKMYQDEELTTPYIEKTFWQTPMLDKPIWQQAIIFILCLPLVPASFVLLLLALVDESWLYGGLSLASIIPLVALGLWNNWVALTRAQQAKFRRELPYAMGCLAIPVGFIALFVILMSLGKNGPPSEYEREQAQAINTNAQRRAQIAKLQQFVTFENIPDTLSGKIREPYLLVDMSEYGDPLLKVESVKQTELLSEAATVAVFKYTATKVGDYRTKSLLFSRKVSNAYEYHVHACLIDPSEPTRRRVVHFQFTPPQEDTFNYENPDNGPDKVQTLLGGLLPSDSK